MLSRNLPPLRFLLETLCSCSHGTSIGPSPLHRKLRSSFLILHSSLWRCRLCEQRFSRRNTLLAFVESRCYITGVDSIPCGGVYMDNGTAHPRMLADCKVLDFTQYLAGPTVTRLMAEMGARIVKVEQAPMGDPARLLPFVKEGRSAYFVQQNRGKKSVCLDFNKPEGIELLHSLVKTVDVVVENFGPGVMEKRGLDYASLKTVNPKIIMVSISAFGRKSPLSHKVGYDLIAQAFSGIMHMTGEADGPPQFVGLGIADVSSGVHAFAALGYALYYREKTGIGQHIDMAMVDALYHMHEVNIQVHTMTGGQYVPKRAGSHHPLVCPVGTFKGPQGWIVILALDRQWEGMCKALGKPEL